LEATQRALASEKSGSARLSAAHEALLEKHRGTVAQLGELQATQLRQAQELRRAQAAAA
jgi:hypothetical protein